MSSRKPHLVRRPLTQRKADPEDGRSHVIRHGQVTKRKIPGVSHGIVTQAVESGEVARAAQVTSNHEVIGIKVISVKDCLSRVLFAHGGIHHGQIDNWRIH